MNGIQRQERQIYQCVWRGGIGDEAGARQSQQEGLQCCEMQDAGQMACGVFELLGDFHEQKLRPGEALSADHHVNLLHEEAIHQSKLQCANFA